VDSDHVIDVDRLMADVRERVAAKRASGLYDDDPADVELVFEEPLERLARLAPIGGRREALVSSAPRIGPALTVARRASLKAVAPFLEDLLLQINAFHFELVATLREADDRVEDLERLVQELESRLRALEDR
jgi:hypothetical protein